MARLVLALAATLAALQVASPCQDPGLALRCPDLVMAVPSHLRLDRKRDGRRFLRMENSIVNIGNGPAELFARRSGAKEMAAEQVITDLAGGRHRFATGAEVYYTSVPSRGGDYWKFDQAARFELWSQLPTGQAAALVRVGPKLRYCLRDLRRVGTPGPGSLVPARRVYPACNQKRDKQQVTLGTSVGWADRYPASYPGNVIDVTGLNGCFVVIQRADPANHVIERDEANNASARTVRLPDRPGLQRCPPYVP
jgi:hypothetical protein